MYQMKIIKQKLLSEPFSVDALKLARAIYFTHLTDGNNLYLEVKLTSVRTLLHLHSNKETVEKVESLLRELNEPLAVKEFDFFGKTYPMRFVTFCKYNINKNIVEVELGEEFLHAENFYMLDSFLTN
ncbi:MAG: hypothetical protein J7L21_06570 [Sulfurimonas sp.]|nr:hypothetical protein [Sulfurimonas sp.]